MGNLFVTEGMVMVDDLHSIAAIDTTLMKAKGSVWHKSSMKKGILPCPAGIDTGAKWGITVIPRRMGLWIQTTFYIYNRRELIVLLTETKM